MARRFNFSPQAAGFTVVEAVVTVAVLAIVATLAVPSATGLLQSRRLEAASQWLQADLTWLRTQALIRQQTLRWSLFSSAAGTCWIIHSGDPGRCTCRVADDLRSAPATCAAGATLFRQGSLPSSEGVSLKANTTSMRVDPHLGTFTPTGSLDLTTATGLHVREVINVLGRVRLCSMAKTWGLPAC